MHVQTHNIRKTAITEYYNECKDIVATQKFVGHSNINVTQLYVGKTTEEINKTVGKLFKTRKVNQTQLPKEYQINTESGIKIVTPAPPKTT